MQIKTISPMHVYCFETVATLQTIMQYVRVVARNLYSEAAKNELEITGPVYWLYDGADGRPDTEFSLTIAIPVTPGVLVSEQSEFKLKTIEPFNCLAEQHLGDWGKLGETYGRLMSEIHSKNMQMTGLTREIYIHMDFEHPEANITEVQIGITG
jgi:effector-binding domain-containing protein